MLWIPQKGLLRAQNNLGSVGDNNPGDPVTTGASAGVKGAVAELIAAAAFDAYLLHVFSHSYGLTATATRAVEISI